MKELLVLIGSIVFFLYGIFMLSFLLVEFDCNQYKHVTGKETKANYGTCFIKQDGEWLAWEEYKLRNATKGNPK